MKLRTQAQGRRSTFICGLGARTGLYGPAFLWPWNPAKAFPSAPTRGEKQWKVGESGNEVALGTPDQGRLELGCQGRSRGGTALGQLGVGVKGGGPGMLEQRACSDHGENCPLAKARGREWWAVGLAFVPATLMPFQGSNPRPLP